MTRSTNQRPTEDRSMEQATNRSKSVGSDGRPQEAICERAHAIYVARVAAAQPGDAVSDWLQAERELATAGETEIALPGSRARTSG